MRKIQKSASISPGKGPLNAKKLIVVALPLLSEGEIPLVQGIREELERREGFEVMVLSGGYEATLRRLAATGQLAGAIGEFISGRWLEDIRSMGASVVQIGSDAGLHPEIPSIGTDIRAMALEATQALRMGELSSIGYLGPAGQSGSHGSPQLCSTLAEICQSHGIILHHSPATSETLVKSFLQSLPRPSGLLCASDRLARIAIIAARGLGWRIPQDFSVIGVGNSRIESLHANIPISSFELPLGEIGRRSGILMASLLQEFPLKIPASPPLRARFHERESSFHSSSGISRALAYLRNQPETNMTAGELARLAGMSRRSFEVAMRKRTGTSPGIYLQQMRRKRAEQLLGSEELAIAAVGQACGYAEPAVFSAAFRRWTGKSPREFRKDQSAGKS